MTGNVLPSSNALYSMGNISTRWLQSVCDKVITPIVEATVGNDLSLKGDIGKDVVTFNSIIPNTANLHSLGSGALTFKYNYCGDMIQDVDYNDFARRNVLSTATTSYSRVTSIEWGSTFSKYYAPNDDFNIPNAGEFLFIFSVKLDGGTTNNELYVRLRNLGSTGFSNIGCVKAQDFGEKDFETLVLYWRCEINAGEKLALEWKSRINNITNCAIENGRIYCMRNYIW